MSWSIGIDVAGYSTGKSGVVALRKLPAGNFEACVVRDSPFSAKVKGVSKLDRVVSAEADFIDAMCSVAPVYIDVPIDLQDLMGDTPVEYAWQLTKRAADVVFGGLPPLSDKIGSPVARIRNLLKHCSGDLGSEIFETYPAASLALILSKKPKYKNSDLVLGEAPLDPSAGLPLLAKLLGLSGPVGCRITDDDIDAILCALCGLVDEECVLQGPDLEQHLASQLPPHHFASAAMFGDVAPKGYVLLRQLPRIQITIVETDLGNLMQRMVDA